MSDKNVSRPAAPELMEEPAVGGPDAIDRLEASVRELRAELAKRDAIRASRTEEMLAEALRRGIGLMPNEGYVSDSESPLGSARQYFSEAMRTLRAALAAYDQARAGQQQTERNQCDGCLVNRPLNASGNHLMGDGEYPDLLGCQAYRYQPALSDTPDKTPPDAGSVGQALDSIKAAHRTWTDSAQAFIETVTAAAKPDPRPAPCKHGWRVACSACEMEDPQPAPKCQKCGDTGYFLLWEDDRGGYFPPCPDCSKPTGGTP